MIERKIAVITNSIKAFERYVSSVYESLPNDKSIVVYPAHKFITIEHPLGVGRKYFPVKNMDDLIENIFDHVEKSDDYPYELYEFAVRIYSFN